MTEIHPKLLGHIDPAHMKHPHFPNVADGDEYNEYSDATIIEDGETTYDLDHIAVDTGTLTTSVILFVDLETLQDAYTGDQKAVNVAKWEFVVGDDEGNVVVSGRVTRGQRAPNYIMFVIDPDT